MRCVPGSHLTEENASAVAQITARLDGLPLAIELAATRTKLLTPEQMLPRLQARLSILTSGARTLPQRQRTLRDAIGWSHDLLDAADQRLFARLSAFTGGWTLEAAEAVCDPDALGMDALDGLTSLVDKSLVRWADSSDADPRFSMLETIREFGREQLDAGDDLEPVLRRHADYFLDLALAAEPHLTSDEQGEWLDRCDREHANIRAALRWAIDAAEADRAQASAGALWRFWQQRGHLAEGRRWLEEILAMPSGQGQTAARAKALTGRGGNRVVAERQGGGPRPSTGRRSPSSESWATPLESPRPCTTRRSSRRQGTTSTSPFDCSRRAWISSARWATSPGLPESSRCS